MTTAVKKTKPIEKTAKTAKSKKKSKLTLFWEKVPENRFEIVDMRAILK